MTDLLEPATVVFETETLSVTVAGMVAELTLTRPEMLNCFDRPLHLDFVEALARIRKMKDVRAVVFASTGKAFSAGGSFELMQQFHDDHDERTQLLDEGRELTELMIGFPLPVVVALHGDALGLGASMILACDSVVAANAARIGDPHVRVGLVAGDGGCVMWPQLVGMMRAKRFLLTGDAVRADEAYGMGMVTDLVDEPEDVLPVARALATRIAALPPLAVRGTKQALSRVMQQRSGEVLQLAIALEATTLASDDLLEAIAAFKEKRPGNFLGR